ncbi:MAG TPA: YlxR family protein [Gaiellaceae bacterium]|nr:YlxR family protein [Gaiellaceae bacterium]
MRGSSRRSKVTRRRSATCSTRAAKATPAGRARALRDVAVDHGSPRQTTSQAAPPRPIRTCAGCGRKAPQSELVRFVARDLQLTPSPKGPGRGVYTCGRLACFERAVANRAFSRTLRANVQVDPRLARLYTDTNG